MKKMLAVAALGLALAGCATERDNRALVGGALGAGTGAIIGAAATGTAGGAAVGGVLGGAAGAIIGGSTAPREGYYWDRGACYYQYPSGATRRVSRGYCR